MWKVYFFKVISGEIGPAVEPTSLSWSITLNGTEDISMTVMKSELVFGDMETFMEPWWGGILLAWGNVPIVAGPIVNRPEEDMKSISFQAQGIRSLLAKRSPVADMNNWANLKKIDYINAWNSSKIIGGPDRTATALSISDENLSSYRWYNKAYGNLARMVVEESIEGKSRGGYLPITFDHASTENDTSDNNVAEYKGKPENRPHLLTFRGVDDPNVDKILSTLTDRENGPDILFIPRLNTNTFSIYWDMYTGTNDKRRSIPLTRPEGAQLFWDITAPNSDVSDFSVKYSGVSMINRLYSQTAGDNGAVYFNENTSAISAGYPLMERFNRFQNATNSSAFTTKSNAMFNGNKKPITELSAKVRTTDSVNPPGSFWPGEDAKIHVGTDTPWLGLTTDLIGNNGVVTTKILKMSGDLSNDIELTFKESYVEDE